MINGAELFVCLFNSLFICLFVCLFVCSFVCWIMEPLLMLAPVPNPD